MDDDKHQEDALCPSRHPAAGTAPETSCLPDEWFERLPRLSEACLGRHHRPLVTVSYAQSVDGSIATRNREQLRLSSHPSMVMTHRIRASSDAIIIGINTLLADDPRLTVRHIQGTNPQPIVLDSKLRIPLQARLLSRIDRRCWLACTDKHDTQRANAVKSRGAELIPCRHDERGMVDLADLLHLLGRRGIRSIMVEGGSQVITSFLEARLVDQLIITIAPQLVGGLPVLERPATVNGSRLGLHGVCYQPCGPDIILWAQPRWQDP